jgi:putative nucleotidyltransferase with HDIG domain
MNELVMALENDVKKLHFGEGEPEFSYLDIDKSRKYSEFWRYHVSVVINLSVKLAIKYGAHSEVVWTAAILHDIGRLLVNGEPHDQVGSSESRLILSKRGFEEEFIRDVSGVILTHRCRDFEPESLEQKVLATADAMAHFVSPFYLWSHTYSSKPFKEQLEGNYKKINRDFYEKIFFEEERESIASEYGVLLRWIILGRALSI